jgi:hypothetical protein
MMSTQDSSAPAASTRRANLVLVLAVAAFFVALFLGYEVMKHFLAR